ncbi:hypothetical protein KDW_58200 [Dictyobacter vulcani]|uniref:Carrier domain-containing protein n=1 Tax=Dictyobacter vulcani TaxID=2607529 RepID=A0A5J4KPL1_9CHLR|nr:phosphopantetheine-binding protein [Dictyobacter vulcani]GER91658.1 hypothetical protein KDW_58200 [Dictyobacter vulcani]
MQQTQTVSQLHYSFSVQDIQQILIDLVSAELNLKGIQGRHNFFDLGCKSLTIRTLQMQLQQQLNCTIPIITFYMHPTIEMLAQHLYRQP